MTIDFSSILQFRKLAMAKNKKQSKAWAEKQKKRRDAQLLKKVQNQELLSILNESKKQVDADNKSVLDFNCFIHFLNKNFYICPHIAEFANITKSFLPNIVPPPVLYSSFFTSKCLSKVKRVSTFRFQTIF